MFFPYMYSSCFHFKCCWHLLYRRCFLYQVLPSIVLKVFSISVLYWRYFLLYIRCCLLLYWRCFLYQVLPSIILKMFSISGAAIYQKKYRKPGGRARSTCSTANSKNQRQEQIYCTYLLWKYSPKGVWHEIFNFNFFFKLFSFFLRCRWHRW